MKSIERERAELSANEEMLGALLERIGQRQLEAGDLEMILSLVSKEIAELKSSGQESVLLELPPDNK